MVEKNGEIEFTSQMKNNTVSLFDVNSDIF